MKEGTASHTARSVAARRLEYERVAAPYGDPAADDAATDSDRQRSAGLLLARAASAPFHPERVRPAPPPPATRESAPAGTTRPAGPGTDPPGAARPPGPVSAPGPEAAAAAPGTPERADAPARASKRRPRGAGAGHSVTGSTARTAPAPPPALPPPALPLSALLSQALVAFTIEADNEAEHRLPHRVTIPGGPAAGVAGGGAAPWLTSLLMYANCLRHLPDEGVTIAELARRARTGTNLDGMRRWGYVTFTPDPGRGKRPRPDALIRPTAAGIAARDTWHQVTPAVESRWRDRLGEEEFTALRAALVAVVVRLDPLLPDCLPILGHGLVTRRDGGRPPGPSRPPGDAGPAPVVSPGDAGPAPAAQPGPAGSPGSAPSATPPSAQPPSAVTTPGAAPPPGAVTTPHPATAPAAPGSAAAGFAAGLPLWALLSRALLAFARQYEAEPGPSLAIGADVLRVLTADGVPTRDIPARGGISRESVAMAAGVLRQWRMAAEGPDPAGGRFKVTRLTARGVAARDEYPVLAAAIERDWRARLGDARVTALRAALESLAAGDPPPLWAGLEPYPDGWRARRPPLATLPHYPVTLHRGGYPDGS